MEFPEIFQNERLIAKRDNRALVADGLCAWASCMCGSKPPESFGRVLIAIREKIGMNESPTADNFGAFAKREGWLK